MRLNVNRLLDKKLLSAFICMNFFMWISLPLSTDAMLLEGRVSTQAEIEPVENGIVGINFDIRHNSLPLITEVYTATPASKAGLKAGDEVLAINSISTDNLSYNQIDRAISNIPGDTVCLLIKRKNSVFPVNLTVESLDNIKSKQIRALYLNLLSN